MPQFSVYDSLVTNPILQRFNLVASVSFARENPDTQKEPDSYGGCEVHCMLHSAYIHTGGQQRVETSGKQGY